MKRSRTLLLGCSEATVKVKSSDSLMTLARVEDGKAWSTDTNSLLFGSIVPLYCRNRALRSGVLGVFVRALRAQKRKKMLTISIPEAWTQYILQSGSR